MESHQACVYWRAREESLEACAERAALFLQLLARCDPCFSRWFEQANSRKRALQLPFEPSRQVLLELFGKKTYRRSGGGVLFGAWTGAEVKARGAMTLIRCGSSDALLNNSCVLHLPSEEPEAGRVLTAPKVAEVLRAMVLAWAPDWGLVSTWPFREAQPETPSSPTPLGWVTYLSRQWGEVSALPEPVRVEPVEDKGHLVVLTPEPVSASNPEHLALAARVRQGLRPTDLF